MKNETKSSRTSKQEWLGLIYLWVKQDISIKTRKGYYFLMLTKRIWKPEYCICFYCTMERFNLLSQQASILSLGKDPLLVHSLVLGIVQHSVDISNYKYTVQLKITFWKRLIKRSFDATQKKVGKIVTVITRKQTRTFKEQIKAEKKNTWIEFVSDRFHPQVEKQTWLEHRVPPEQPILWTRHLPYRRPIHSDHLLIPAYFHHWTELSISLSFPYPTPLVSNLNSQSFYTSNEILQTQTQFQNQYS